MSYFVIIDGFIYSCGNNKYGQLGLDDEKNRQKLTQVVHPTCKFVSVSNYFSHTVAVDENGHLWSCGYNQYGQLGLNDNIDRSVLTQVSSTQTFQAVACGDYHTAAIDIDGFLWVCGDNGKGQLGLGFNAGERHSSLTKVNNTKFIAISCSADHTIVIDENGFLWGCGSNTFKQLGVGQCEEVEVLTKICQQKFIAISSDDDHTVAIDIDGHLWSCGQNIYGQLCYDSDKKTVPILSKVPNLELSVAIMEQPF